MIFSYGFPVIVRDRKTGRTILLFYNFDDLC